MRKINVNTITENIKEMCIQANHFLADDMDKAMKHALETEEAPLGRQILDQVVKQLRLQKDDGYETAAVLVMTEDEAHDIYMLLKNRSVSVSYIDRDSTSFHPGLTVTTFYLAKGLEFDQVFTIYEENGNPLLPQARYICATRALHELYMYRLEPEKRDR